MRRYLYAALLAACLWPVLGAVVRAGDAGTPTVRPQIAGVQIGFAGRYKVGTWTPALVALENAHALEHGALRLTVPDGDGVPSTVTVPVEAGQTSVPCVLRFGRVESRLEVELLDAAQSLTKRVFRAGSGRHSGLRPAVSATRRLIVCLAADEMGVRSAVELSGIDPADRPEVVRVDDCRELPLAWYGYEGVDLLVVSTSSPELFDAERLDPARLVALDAWIRHGGKMVLSAGAAAEATIGESGPLARFAPGRLTGVARLRQTGAWESYAGSTVRISAGGRGAGVAVAQLTDIDGVVELREAGAPLVVHSAQGLGQVAFVATDLDRPPIAEWADRPALLQKLLGLKTSREDEGRLGSSVMHFGYRNIAGQLRSGLDSFSDVRLLAFSLVAAMMVVYVLAIGVGDYFLLRRVVGRMRWTWLTFPLVVALVCAAAYALAHHLKGDEIRLNQVNLVDVDVGGGRVRATSYMNLFSPRVEAYDLAVRPQLPGGSPAKRAEVLLAWLGLPGGALGGMAPQTTAFSEIQRGYDFSPQLDALQGMPVEQWATKSLTARWTAEAQMPVEADLVAEDRVTTGTIVHRFDRPLEDCLLVYRSWVFDLGTLEPGKPFRIHSQTKRSELKTLLTGRRIVQENETFRQESTPYDLASRDLAYILRTMMFFEAAGGRRYTGLNNNYQGFVDFSDLLDTGRAILVARPSMDGGADAPAVLLRDGEPLVDAIDRQLTVYRFVLPVANPSDE